MSIDDFLIEYDLTPDQLKLAARLKAEAHLKHLLNTLADHSLFYSRVGSAVRHSTNSVADCGLRASALTWFASLDVSQRISVLACDDASWIRTVLRMSCLQGSSAPLLAGSFAVAAKATAAGQPLLLRGGRSPADRSRAETISRDPSVHYRRPYRSPDGEMLAPAATTAFRKACGELVRGMRVAFRGCCSASLAFEWAAIVPSPDIVGDPTYFASLMEEVSLGRYLHAQPVEPPPSGGSSWLEAPWLLQWGTHFPLAAFMCSRLEVLWFQGYAARNAHSPPRPFGFLALVEVWTNMLPSQREVCLRRVGSSLFRRLLFDTLAAGSAEGRSAWQPQASLAVLLTGAAEARSSCPRSPVSSATRLPPLEFVAAVSTAPLVSASLAAGGAKRDMLLSFPKLWLHQQFAEELAIMCSEHSANALLERDLASQVVAEATAVRCNRRREKKHRQKLRRRQAAEEPTQSCPTEAASQERFNSNAHSMVADVLHEIIEAALEHCGNTCGCRAAPGQSPQDIPDASHVETEPQMQWPRLEMEEAVDVGLTPRPYLPQAHHLADEWDGYASEVSSIGVATMSRSNSMSSIGHSSVPFGRSMLERRWNAEMRAEMLHAMRRSWRPPWHDDSRLEFLLRSRDLYATEMEWDRMSQCSVPASLDESRPMGLESRFAYLFDSPPRSHATSARASQATAEDDAERLTSQWEDFEEWNSLTQALEKTEGELQAWKGKAQELEEIVAKLQCQQPARKALERHRLLVEGAEVWDVAAERLATECGVTDPNEGVAQGELLRDVSITSGGPVHRQISPQTDEPSVTSPNSGTSTGSSPLQATAPQISKQQTRRLAPADVRGGVGGGGGSDVVPADLAWRYLVLLALARRQLDIQREAQPPQCGPPLQQTPPIGLLQSQQPYVMETAVVGRLPRSYSLPNEQLNPCVDSPDQEVQTPSPSCAESSALATARHAERSVSLPSGRCLTLDYDEGLDAAVANAISYVGEGAVGAYCEDGTARGGGEGQARKRALHATFDARYKPRHCDGATQTAPAITLSGAWKLYDGMVPRFIQGELARLRQENQILRCRVASLAMSQPLEKPQPARDQATQTAPAITFFTGGARGGGPSLRVGSIPRLPRDLSARRQGNTQLGTHPLDTAPILSDSARSVLDESIRAFSRAVQLQTQRREAYRSVVQNLCKRVVQTLWPRSSVELYGSFASGLALPSSGFDLVIKPHKQEDAGQYRLSPIEEDAEHMRQMPLDELSPGHTDAVPSLSSGWQQQLSSRLAREKWVLSDSIRISALAAVPVLSIITAPEDVAATPSQAEEPLSCPIRVDISLEDPNHRGRWSKAIIEMLLGEFPHARPVTLVLKQWLIERTYGTSHTGGLCSYGLLLLVIGYLQHYPAESAAVALVGFLHFYGRRFDPQLYAVSVARRAFLHRKRPSTWPPVQAEYIERGFCPSSGDFAALPRKLAMTGEEAHRFDPLWIEDPLNPTNNVGRNCFRLRQIQLSLARAADALTASEVSSQLREILRIEGPADGDAGEEADAPRGPLWDEARWQAPVHARRAHHEDLYQSLVEHAPNLMMPLPGHAQIARSHLPQQWDSAVRYGGRPSGGGGSRGHC